MDAQTAKSSSGKKQKSPEPKQATSNNSGKLSEGDVVSKGKVDSLEGSRDSSDIPSLDLNLSNGRDLLSSYTTFFSNGGFFVKTDQSFSLGDVVRVFVKVPSGSTVYTVLSRVVWIVPPNAEDRRTQGVGVSLDDDSDHVLELRDKINSYLSEHAEKVERYSVFPFPS
ncbi:MULTISPECIES: PilZ domain-containing protein [Candidatus Ichthyocystis]|uniref:PilZ domain-containing protein n=1 Tax=Candidatus Ichthyocystis TaxID=2929841 RepID=UPI000B879B35|nr:MULTISPECIES: PilZ domain-containing protein [Ichthyocystis]